MFLIGNGRLVTRSPRGIIENGCVAIEGERIAEVGETPELRKKHRGCAFIDAKGGLIMPGYINAHMHFYSAFARGMFLDGPPNKNFSQILENLWWRMDNKLSMEDVKYSAYATYLECIRNGVTTVIDHHASYGAVEGSLFAIYDAARELNVRSSLCYEVSDRNGREKADAAIKENADFIKFAKDKGHMISGMMGLHASFTVSDKTLEKCAEAMAGTGAGYHVHTAEGPEDARLCVEQHGCRIVERFNRFGLLSPASIAVHCVHVDDGEIGILKDTGVTVVHNPQSNMGNAVGCSRVTEMMERGVFTALGTDGYTSDVLCSLKTANIIHKHRTGDPSAMWAEPPKMLFGNNREAAKRVLGADVGALEKGALADVIVVDYAPHTPVTADNIDSHIHFGITGKDTVTSVINGKTVMLNREILLADEAEILAKARDLAAKLWKRI